MPCAGTVHLGKSRKHCAFVQLAVPVGDTTHGGASCAAPWARCLHSASIVSQQVPRISLDDAVLQLAAGRLAWLCQTADGSAASASCAKSCTDDLAPRRVPRCGLAGLYCCTPARGSWRKHPFSNGHSLSKPRTWLWLWLW